MLGTLTFEQSRFLIKKKVEDRRLRVAQKLCSAPHLGGLSFKNRRFMQAFRRFELQNQHLIISRFGRFEFHKRIAYFRFCEIRTSSCSNQSLRQCYTTGPILCPDYVWDYIRIRSRLCPARPATQIVELTQKMRY